MSYCKKCGNQLDTGQKFCTKCGSHFEPDHKEAVLPLAGLGGKLAGLMNSKKAKITLASVLAAGILFVSGYFVIGSQMSPQAVVDDFIEAVKEEDVEKVQKLINEGQFELEADASQTKLFIDYLHSNPRILSSMADQLQSESALYEQAETPSSITNSDVSSIVSLAYLGGKWLLFDDYAIAVKPFYVDVFPVSDEGEIYIEEKKLGTLADEEQSFGPFLPGEYQVKAVFDGDYGKVEQELKISTLDAVDRTVSVEFDLSSNYVDLYPNHDDAILYVNGKSTGQEIGEIGEMGPVLLDGSVTVFAQKQFSSGTKKSDEVTLDEDTRVAELFVDGEGETDFDTEDTSMNDDADETMAIEQSIRAHYENISGDQFAAAYHLFSSDRRSKVTLEGWTKGLQENIRDEVTALEVKGINGNTASAYIEMTSYDQQEDGSMLIQNWGGNWSLVKENGSWTLDDADLEKLGSRIE